MYPRRLEDATRHMSGWRKAKKLTAAASATRALTEMLPNLDDSQKHWVAFAVHLSLPMGLGFDHNHRVSEIKPTGSGFADRQVQVGDWLTHFDGVDLRQSGQSIMDVLDRGCGRWLGLGRWHWCLRERRRGRGIGRERGARPARAHLPECAVSREHSAARTSLHARALCHCPAGRAGLAHLRLGPGPSHP